MDIPAYSSDLLNNVLLCQNELEMLSNTAASWGLTRDLSTGMLVKAEPAGPLLGGVAPHHHHHHHHHHSNKMDNSGSNSAGSGGHTTDPQSAVAIPGSGQQGGQIVNGSSGGSQGGSSGRSSPAVDPSPNKLFVGGLSWQTTSDRLREYFVTYGTVKDVLIMKDPITQRSRGFGFITFGDPSSVEKVIAMPNHVLDGKKIDPKHATPKNRGRNNRTKKIFVGGVSQETSAEEVKQYFTSFGNVEEAVMLMDNQTKRHRGFGFVTFECEDVVERVCEIHFHSIKNKKVECKKAQPKEAVQAASLLTKRLMLPAPGMAMAGVAGMAGSLMTAQQAAALASAQAAALTSYGKLVGGTYPPLSAYRYAPYPLPPTAATAATHQQNAAVVSHLPHQTADSCWAQQQYSTSNNNYNTHHPVYTMTGGTPHHAAIAAAAAAAVAAAPPQSTAQGPSAYTTSGHPHHHALSAAAAAAAAAGGASAASSQHSTAHHTGHSMVATMPGAHSQTPVFTSPTSLAGAPPPHHASFTPAAANPYQGYSLANVDMSSFQGIDWSAMYGVGMYA